MLSPIQVNAISELAGHLYDYLPGSSQYGAYTFESAAKAIGLGRFWEPGSKLPAITSLLESTLDQEPAKFVSLVERIVTEGLKYRRRKGNPVTREDVLFVTRALRGLGFAYSTLGNEAFLSALPTGEPGPAPEAHKPEQGAPPSVRADVEAELDSLRDNFLSLRAMKDRQSAGLALEPLLNRLFQLFGLNPTGPFRVVGEQIDGAFVLDGDVYLLEAKWCSPPIPEADLLVFRGKVEGKSPFTRGLFVSVNGYTKEAVLSIVQGKQPNFVMLDGAHLYRALDGAIPFDELLRTLVQRLAQQGRPYVPVAEL